jgi:hypothetical protein
MSNRRAAIDEFVEQLANFLESDFCAYHANVTRPVMSEKMRALVEKYKNRSSAVRLLICIYLLESHL